MREENRRKRVKVASLPKSGQSLRNIFVHYNWHDWMICFCWWNHYFFSLLKNKKRNVWPSFCHLKLNLTLAYTVENWSKVPMQMSLCNGKKKTLVWASESLTEMLWLSISAQNPQIKIVLFALQVFLKPFFKDNWEIQTLVYFYKTNA